MNSKEFDWSWYRRANASIHGGALTNSKRPESFVRGVYPTHLTKAEGCYVYDTNNKKYIDYICGLGSNLFGYANIQINQAIYSQFLKGAVYSLSSTLEVECAELLKSKLHFIDKVRFLKTGTEACMAAIKIARAHTGRTKILSDGYHGWSDPFVSLTPPSCGVPGDPNIEKLSFIKQIDSNVAAVIIEPIITDYGPDRIKYLIELKDACKKAGALLIFDEIITGMRWLNFTFSNDFGIYPDIICLGKAFGGGMPLSIVGTKQGIGDSSNWFVSSTFAGDLIALTGMKKSIDLLNSNYKIVDLWAAGKQFIDEFNANNGECIQIVGYPTRGAFKAVDDLTKALFFQEACKAGILFGSSWFYNFKHIELNKIVLSTCKDIAQQIKNNNVKLEGELPVLPYAQKIRG